MQSSLSLFLVYSPEAQNCRQPLNSPGLVYTLCVACMELTAAKSSQRNCEWPHLCNWPSETSQVNFSTNNECTIEEEINTFIHCTMSPAFLKNGKICSNYTCRPAPFPVADLVCLPSKLVRAPQKSFRCLTWKFMVLDANTNVR